MSDDISRRDSIKAIGAVTAAGLVPVNPFLSASASARTLLAVRDVYADGDIVDLYSTSDVTLGGGRMKFSFDFPEPGVVFGSHRYSFLIFTDENTYSLDRARLKASGCGDALQLVCDGLAWAGGQERAPGNVTVTFKRIGTIVTWDIVSETDKPIKTVTTVIRDVPRAPVGLGGAQPQTGGGRGGAGGPGEVLGGYTFGAGDLHGVSTPGISTPVAVVQASDQDYLWISTLDDRVRPKRFYFQPGETAYRVEVIYEHDGWRNDKRVVVPTWRMGHATSFDAALAPHMEHIERAFNLSPFETRTDAPTWMRNLAMATTLHGMHYTGFIFNDYAQQLEILRWMATQIPPDRVLVFLSSWDGRYYWDYPNYKVPQRMGGEAGFRALIAEGKKLGFRMMPMFGTNAANRKQPVWKDIAAAATYKIDGDLYNLNWVDWNNDRHQDGWLTYMNLGHDAWRNHLEGRIAEMIERFGVDAYFLDIVGGHVNSTNGDMHEGTKKLVLNLREKYPKVACAGEMSYDALHGFIPLYQVGLGPRWSKYSRSFSHLSSPAPGRGSSGVHESGFGRFNNDTLGLYPGTIPTLQVVDDTFTKYRDVMAQVIARAKQRAGIA